MERKFDVILADPPWSYRNKRTGGSMKSGALDKYDTMTTDEICNLPVPDIAKKDCVLFLWATVPMLPDAFRVMDAWGFKYKTMLTWRKIMSLGMGFWFRGQTEHLLLGVRGNIKAFRCQKCNFIQCRAQKHSKKPDEFYDLIEAAIEPFNLTDRVELFARDRREGWAAWGNEIESDKVFGGKT